MNKRKKNSRQRGTHTHGWGSKKKHRGAGHRGGRGRAGSGKKCDSKKPSFWKDKSYYGKKGFSSKSRLSIRAINLSFLDSKILTLVKAGKALKEGDSYKIDLHSIGYNKLLGNGKIKSKFIITVAYVSKTAKKKVEDTGGSISGLVEKKIKKKFVKTEKAALPDEKDVDEKTAEDAKETAPVKDDSAKEAKENASEE